MSELAFASECLNRVMDGAEPTREECLQMYQDAASDPAEIFAAAAHLRTARKGRTITFSKKAFFNVINLCRDACSYCTYKAEPAQAKMSMMDPDAVEALLGTARRYRCVEALLVTGERPEERYAEARLWLKSHGFSSTPEYLMDVSERALEAGLFPHTNAGNLEGREMRLLADTNVSMGLMLESTSERLAERGMPHHLAPSKRPAERVATLKEAGRLRIPMTTGILAGIGETIEEAIDSLLTIREIHRRYGHIQETILQNFWPKQDTAMRGAPPADASRFMLLVSLARIIMPDMNIQIPPNLSPGWYHRHVHSGINDWGGVSPFTPDHVNPELPWPAISEIEQRCRDSGYELRCRFPVYPEFARMARPRLQEKMRAVSDEDGLVSGAYWR